MELDLVVTMPHCYIKHETKAWSCYTNQLAYSYIGMCMYAGKGFKHTISY